MKDCFSSHSELYKKYRPIYPREFFDYLDALIPDKENAWDCGTGNGQVAKVLSKSFQNVYATDISQNQLNAAYKADNLHYSLQPAENTSFENDLFNLVIVSQAVHWFNFEKFYSEVRRTAKNFATLCIVGYGLIELDHPMNKLIRHFYNEIIGPFWDEQRKFIDKNYKTIPFPFEEIETPEFTIRSKWSLADFIGYLNTWSAVNHFIKEKGYNPLIQFEENLHNLWEADEIKEVKFSVLLRIGKV